MGSRCLLLGIALFAACGGDDGPTEAPWVTITESRPAALLSVWGSSATDVYVVGGDPRDGTGPMVFHYDGAAWTKLDTTQRDVDIWWTFGFEGGPVFFSGSNGTILRYQNNTFEKLTTPGNAIVFGMWGAAPNDVWAVGGNFGGGNFVWHFDGAAWTAVTVPEVTTTDTLWKINGRAANDFWISGTTGITLHYNGTAFERVDVPVEASLFSVAAMDDRFIAVGGAFDGILFENDGSGWQSKIPTGGPILSGVTASADQAYAVGQFGAVLKRSSSGSWSAEQDVPTNQNLHAAWIDPSGGVWAVGGHFDTPPMSGGVLIHKGDPLQGSIP